MPHSYALRAMKLLLFRDVSVFFSEKKAQRNSLIKWLFHLHNAMKI